MKAELILPDFAKALDRFSEALSTEPTEDLIRAGCIQYFEFTFDLAWKSIQAVTEHYGLDPVKSPRVAFRTAFSQGWILEQQPWLEMLRPETVCLMFTAPRKRWRFMTVLRISDSPSNNCGLASKS